MRVTKMLTEKFIFVFIFFSQAFIKELFMRSKRTCFLLFKNCNTVSCKDCNAKNSFLETVILLYCNAWDCNAK